MERMSVAVCGYSSLDSIIVTEQLLGVGKTSTVRRFVGLSKPLWGGCACNIAVGCANFGMRSLLVTSLGDDPEGKEYFDHLKKAGVDVRFTWLMKGALTPRTILISDASGEHMTLFYASAPVSEQMLNFLTELENENLQYGILTVADPQLAKKFVSVLKRQRIPLLWSFKADPKALSPMLVYEIINYCDVLVANESEIEFLLHIMKYTNIKDLLKHGIKSIVITRGHRGCEIWNMTEYEPIPSVPPNEVIDTTGAGDGFVVGLVLGLVNQLPISISARIGVTTASFVLEGWGAQSTLPVIDQVRDRYIKWFGAWPL